MLNIAKLNSTHLPSERADCDLHILGDNHAVQNKLEQVDDDAATRPARITLAQSTLLTDASSSRTHHSSLRTIVLDRP
jgi:hypothetical protein